MLVIVEDFVKSVEVSDQLYITKEHCVLYKRGVRDRQIALQDIYYIQSIKDYLKIVTEHENYMVLGSIGRAEKLLISTSLIRTHRSFIVNKEHITQRNKKQQNVLLKDITKHISVGRKYKENVWPES